MLSIRDQYFVYSTTRTLRLTHSDGYLHGRMRRNVEQFLTSFQATLYGPFDGAPVTAHSPTQQAQMNVLTVE
jgi:hypothetical protein